LILSSNSISQLLRLTYSLDTSLRESSFFFFSLSLHQSFFDSSYLIVAFTCDRFAHLSTSHGIKIGCHYSLTQFFFNLPLVAVRVAVGECVYIHIYTYVYIYIYIYIHTYLFIYVCVYIHIHQLSKPLRTRAVSSSRPISATSSLRFLRLVFILPRAQSGYVPQHERDSQAFMRISIYSGTLRVLFLDDEERALLTMISARLMKRSACT